MSKALAHFAIPIEDLAEELGLPGTPVRLWVEQETLYLHIICERSQPGRERGATFYHVNPGSYVDISSRPREIKVSKTPALAKAQKRFKNES